MVAQAFNPSSREEAEVGEGQADLQELVPGQLRLLHREILSRKKPIKKIKGLELGSTDKREHTVFVWLWVPSLGVIFSRKNQC